jgi:hypothetical protein
MSTQSARVVALGGVFVGPSPQEPRLPLKRPCSVSGEWCLLSYIESNYFPTRSHQVLPEVNFAALKHGDGFWPAHHFDQV